MGEDGPGGKGSVGVGRRGVRGLVASCVPGAAGAGGFGAFWLAGFAGGGGFGMAAAAVLATSLLGGFAPDLGMPGAPVSRLFGRRGVHASLWAGRFGYDGAPTHGLLAAFAGTVLVAGPAALAVGPAVALAPAAAFLLAYLLHLGADRLLGRHAVGLFWPLEGGGGPRDRSTGAPRGPKGKKGGASAAGPGRGKKRPPRPGGSAGGRKTSGTGPSGGEGPRRGRRSAGGGAPGREAPGRTLGDGVHEGGRPPARRGSGGRGPARRRTRGAGEDG